MKKIDYGSNHVVYNIFQSVIPLMVAQILIILYNVVDRFYIGRIPVTGTVALGGVGVCFPLIILITGFTNMFGMGGTPLFSMAAGAGKKDMARDIQNTSFVLLIISAVVLMVIGEIWAGPILDFFGAGPENLVYAKSYFEIYLAGNIFAMLSGGMNPYITAQGFPRIGMMTIAIGAITNMALDPLFIFVFHMGVAGAAVATVISQFLSAAYSWHFFHSRDNGYPLYGLRKNGRGVYLPYTGDIISLGTVPFIMQTTNSMVLVAANQMLSHLGGALDITIMTIASSVRQILDIPALSIADGTAPLISYNYGAGHLDIMRKAIRIMTAGTFLYTLTGWLCIEGFPHFFAGIFSNDANLIEKAVPALHIFCIAFIFQSLQMSGQTVFRSLGMKKQAIFFSLFRKVILVIPLTYILPYVGYLGKMGVFWAEPVSNVIGGVCCYTTMYFIMHRKLKQMEKQGKYL